MATIEAEKQIREALEKNLEALAAVTPKSLIRKDELGTALSFEDGLPYFERTLKLFKDLHNSNLDGISHEALNQLNTVATQALNEFKNIRDFSIEQHPQNTKNDRDQLINTIRDRYDHYYQILTPHIAYSIRKGTDFEALESQAKETLDELIKIKNNIIEEQESAKKDSDAILESMRKAAAETGVAQHAIYFKEEATEHKEASTIWLWATIIVAVFTIILTIVSIFIYIDKLTEFSTQQAIQLGIAKLFVFSILYYSIIWAGKNYRSHLHNYVLNKHRQNSLSTFQAFVKATDDEPTKNAVLIRATESIFSTNISGFVNTNYDSKRNSPITEIIRAGVETKLGK